MLFQKGFWRTLLLLFLLGALSFSNADSFEDDEGEEDVGTVIGIDLGTTYSVVGVYQNGKVDIIANEQGNRITPSYVAFTEDERLVGESAKNQATKNPENTIFAVKRLIGRRFAEKSVQGDIKHFPYKVAEKNGKPLIKVHYKKKLSSYSPEELSAMILGKLKKLAESYIGKKVTHAVITVPAYFNDAQRKATKDAGAIAGMTVMRIINEPTAAAIAYGIDKKKDKERNVLVYDLGGGTFDVSILTVDGGVFEVKATNGNTHLGGEDFDLKLALHMADLFKKKNDIDLRGKEHKRAFASLKREAERVKRLLSTQVAVKVELDELAGGKGLRETITRSLFEKLCSKSFKDTLKPVRTVLADAKLKKKDIHEVVLVGGSTRIPMVQKLLEDFFEGKKLHKDINPDEAVAYGAAVQAFILSGQSDEDTKDMLLLDVTPLSLGIETVGGVHSKIIPKNTPIPTAKTQTFTTNENDQTSVTISVSEGEAKMVAYNHLLGRFDLSGIEKAPRGVPQIEVSFEIDANGILLVTAKDKASGKNSNLRVDEAMSGASSEEVQKMRENFEKHQEEDERLYNRTVAKNGLDAALHKAEDFKKKQEKSLSAEDLDDLNNLISETKSWSDGAKPSEVEAEEFDAKKKEVEEMLKELEAGDGQKEEGEEEEEEEAEDADAAEEDAKEEDKEKKDAEKGKKEL